MADKSLSSITAAGALTGAEILYLIQSGNSRRTTATALAALALAGLDTSSFVLAAAWASATEVAIDSASTTDVLGAASLLTLVNGTTTITRLGTGINRLRIIRFAGILTLTYDATWLITPTGASIITGAGDVAIVTSDASSHARVVSFLRADGSGLIGIGAIISALTADATPDAAADYVATYDASGAIGKKVLIKNLKPIESIIIAASDENTALVAGTNKFKFRLPYAFTVTGARASLSTAQTSGSIFTVDVNEESVTILSTKLTIDNGEKTSTSALTPAVITDASLADDAEVEVDIDQVGDGTAKGLKVALIGYRT